MSAGVNSHCNDGAAGIESSGQGGRIEEVIGRWGPKVWCDRDNLNWKESVSSKSLQEQMNKVMIIQLTEQLDVWL